MINLIDIRDITGEVHHPDNKESRTQKGKKEYTISIYSLSLPRRFLHHERVSGTILYPFAVRKVETDDGGSGYSVDHLPTGWKVTTYKKRKDGVTAIKALLRETRSNAYTGTRFTDGNYKKLQKVFE